MEAGHLLPHNTTNMALFSWVMASLLFVLTVTCIQPSSCYVVKGSVACVDCAQHHDLSGIVVAMKCENTKQVAAATTDDKGSFHAELPSDVSPSSSKCFARILGGPRKLCSYKTNLVSKIVKTHDSSSYTTSTPLAFFTSCPSKTKAPNTKTASPTIEASKTYDIPLPREWGLAPSSFYFPIIPIGIP